MCKHIVSTFVFAVVFFLNQSVLAASATATPSSSSAAVNIRAIVNLLTPSQLQDFDEQTPILDVIDTRGIVVNSIFPLTTPNFDWTISTLPVNSPGSAQSSSADILIDGSVIARQNQYRQADCDGGGCPFFDPDIEDRLLLTTSVKNIIVRALLQNLTLGDVLNRTNLSNSVTVVFQRLWTTGLQTAIGSHTYTFTASLDVNANVSQTRLNGLQGRSDNRVLPIGQTLSTPTRLTWIAQLNTLGSPARTTLRSSALEFISPNGNVLRRQAKLLTTTTKSVTTLQNSFPSQTLLSNTETLTETVSVPAAIVQQSRNLGFDHILIRRAFTDGVFTHSADVKVRIGSASLADFRITRIDLRFVDGSRRKVVKQGEDVKVIAEINYIGSGGRIRGRWENAIVYGDALPLFRSIIMNPKSPVVSVNPEFVSTRTLFDVPLLRSQRVILSSPVIASNEPGAHILRINISHPQGLEIELPLLRYYVLPDGTHQDPVDLVDIPLLSPTSEGINRSTVFRWNPIANAKMYGYECYAQNDIGGSVVTGALTPARSTALTVSELALDHLVPGRQYWCRIISIDNDGELSGASVLVKLQR